MTGSDGPPASWSPPPRPDAPPPTPTGPSVAEVLVGLGGLSLVAAVVVFAAVTWSQLGAQAQGGLLVAATAAVLGAAGTCRRRDLVATAETLGVVGAALAVVDVQVVRIGLDGVVSPRLVWSVGLALVAAATGVGGARLRLRGLATAGAALAFLPAVVAATGASSGSVLAAVLGTQALGAAALRRRLPPLPAAVAATGAALSWVGAALGLFVLVGAGLDHDPARSPLGAAVLLAGLAAGSIVVGQRARDAALRAAGTALALAPALVAALGTGRPSVVLWVLALEGLAAVVLGHALTSAPVERALLVTGGAAAWTLAATGALGTALIGLADAPDRAPVASIALLAVLSVTWGVVGTRLRQPVLVAAGAGLAFAPLVLAAVPVGTSAVLWVLVAEAAVALAGGAHPVVRGAPDDLVRGVLHLGGASAWTAAATGAVALGADALTTTRPTTPVTSVALLGALAAVVGGGAIVARWGRETAAVALAAATASVLGAVSLAWATASTEVLVTAVSLAAGGLALGAALLVRRDPDRPWTASVATGAAVGGALALVPLEAVLRTIGAIAETAVPRQPGAAGDSLTDRLAATEAARTGPLPSVASLGQLVALVLLAGAVALLWRRRAAWPLAAVGVVGAVAAPVALGASVAATSALLAAVLVLGTARLVHRPDEPVLVAALAALAPVLLGVALASVPLALAATGLVVVLVGILAADAVRRDARTAPAWVATAIAASSGAAALAAVLLGATGSAPALALTATALVGAGIAPLVEARAGRTARTTADVADVVVAGALGTGLLATTSIDGASVVVAAVVVASGASALRPTRRPLWLASTAATVVLTWMRLAVAGVELVEAYSLPLAGALLAAGVLARRGVPRTSWERVGAGLVAGLAPTTAVALVDGDVTRTVAVVAAGVAVTLWGARGREQAPLALGGAVVAAVAVRHLGPVAADLPRWLVLGVAGVVLLAAGATFEQRRRDLRAARDAFAGLR